MHILREMVKEPAIYDYFLDDKGHFKKTVFDNWLTSMYSVKTLQNLIRGVKLLPDLEIPIDKVDGAVGMLNTPTGVIDLKRGELLGHSPDYLFTKCTRASWDGVVGNFLDSAEAWLGDSLWSKSIYDIMQGDVEMCLFLQRLLGYSLLGTNPEQILAFFYGTGANGKSLVINTMGYLLGDYHKSTRAENLMLDRFGSSPGKLSSFASLRGCRFVSTSEVSEGQTWDEAILKDITGGDPVQAKFMGKDFFEYQPQCFLMIRGNHQPKINGNDKASWRRFLTVRFGADFENNPLRDNELGDKLKDEQAMSQVIGWLVRGVQEYLRIGLRAPSKVLAMKQQYIEAMNPFGVFLHECCTELSSESPVALGATLDDVARALELWINLYPEKGLEVHKEYNKYRMHVARLLNKAHIASKVVKNHQTGRTERRYPMIINPEWQEAVNSTRIGGGVPVLPSLVKAFAKH